MQSVPNRRQALGFGCADLPFGDQRAALHLLETAFDFGIRHFDVAPLYGRGDAERLLGLFAVGKRDQLTLVTKVGLSPFAPGLKAAAVGAVRLQLQRHPVAERWATGLRNVLRTPVPAAAAGKPTWWRGQFDLERTRLSLQQSLRALRTDHLDLWLLHEGHAEDAMNPALLALLDEAHSSGSVRAYGVGTHWGTLIPRQADIPAAYQALQFENDVLLRTRQLVADRPGGLIITNRSQYARPRCLELLRAQPQLSAKFSADSGIDPLDTAQLSALLLAWTVDQNVTGKVLFGTRNIEHMRSNLNLLDDARYSREAVREFGELIAKLQQESFSA